MLYRPRAEKWNVSDDGKTWTFHLRWDAKWSNGKRVVASDFVASWKRIIAMGLKCRASRAVCEYHRL